MMRACLSVEHSKALCPDFNALQSQLTQLDCCILRPRQWVLRTMANSQLEEAGESLSHELPEGAAAHEELMVKSHSM